MNRYPLASSPLEINGCLLRNRIVRGPHGTGYALPEGIVNDRLIAYHLERARGGVALSILEASGAHPSCPGMLSSFTDAQIEPWSRLADAVHREGMKVFQQIYHLGPQLGRNPFTGQPAWAADTESRPGSTAMSVAMTLGEIDEFVEAFADAAHRIKQAGLDGVEVHGGHGYLIADFLSPLTNHRADEYGGSPENRMRLLHRVVKAVRERVGRDYPVGVRLSGSEDIQGGLAPPDVLLVAQRLEREKLIDFLDLTAGSYFRPNKIIGPMHEEAGYELADNRQITRELSLPTIVTGRLTTLAEAEAILAAGDAKLVSFVRAMIADPHLAAKSFAGREAEVRPCINCNQNCIGGLQRAGAVSCVVNVEAGFESMAPPLEQAARKGTVVVVGGGPAGMEAARTAALRGHQVNLYEAADRLGGNMSAARKAPYRAPIGKIIDYQSRELERLGVEVSPLGAFVTPDMAAGWNADCVIIATGAGPRGDGFQRFNPQGVVGADLPHVRTVRQVLDGDIPAARQVLIYDDFGNYPPLSAAEHLLQQGVDVTLASCEAMIGPQLVFTWDQVTTSGRLNAYRNFRFLAQQFIRAITPDRVELEGLVNGVKQVVEADLVVLWTAAKPRRELEAILRERSNCHFIGDAEAPGDLGFAIRSGHEAGMRA